MDPFLWLVYFILTVLFFRVLLNFGRLILYFRTGAKLPKQHTQTDINTYSVPIPERGLPRPAPTLSLEETESSSSDELLSNIETRKARLFIAYSDVDRDSVVILHDKLSKDGYNTWLDRTRILPGTNRQLARENALRNSDIILVCLSNRSMAEVGQVHRDIKWALEKATKYPESMIVIIPIKLEPCDVPDSLQNLQPLEIYAADGYKNLRRALNSRQSN